jgi:hypothetical protein
MDTESTVPAHFAAKDLPDFSGPFRHRKMASGFAALPHECLNAVGV